MTVKARQLYFALIALAVAADASVAQSGHLIAQDQQQHAVCSLFLQGYPDPTKPGVAAAHLHCKSSSPVDVVINNTYLSNHATYFTGVRVFSNAACQQQAQAFNWDNANESQGQLQALLFFCGNYQLTLQQPQVYNISLTDGLPTGDTAVIAFGGQIKVTINQGIFTGNSAGSTLAILQDAAVNITQGTGIKQNNGVYGAGILVLDNASLAIYGTTLHDNHAGWGGAVLCHHNASVSIDHSNFTNNTATWDGGAADLHCEHKSITNSGFYFNAAQAGGISLFSGAALTINNSRFEANEAKRSGAAINIGLASAVTADNCLFSANIAERGAAAYCDSCKLQMSRVMFVGNRAYDSGGAVDVVAHSQVTFVNATWYNNTALGHGAGLAAQALNLDFTPAATLSCTSCNFTNNTAGGEGGAMFLWNYPYQVVVQGTTFTQNTAASGGALTINATVNITVQSSSFSNNTATHYGGAVDVADAYEVNLIACNFYNNSAAWGGAIDYWTNGTSLVVRGSVLQQNYASKSGGGIFCAGNHRVVLYAVNSTGNSAAEYGGAVAVGGGSQPDESSCITIVHSTFSINQAAAGGALSLQQQAKAVLESNRWLANTASDRGGAIVAVGLGSATSSSSGKPTNDSGASGGLSKSLAIPVSSWQQQSHQLAAENASRATMIGIEGPGTAGMVDVQISSNLFTANAADVGGGAIALHGLVYVTATSSTFHNNSAPYGGAVLCDVASRMTVGDQSSVIDNRAGAVGGAVACLDCLVNIQQTLLTGNSGVRAGGVLHAAGAAEVIITDCNLTNSAAALGGAVSAIDHAVVWISTSRLHSNTADNSGGAVYLGGWSTCSVTGSVMSRNTAAGGGAIAGTSSSQVHISNNSMFHDNSAVTGGAVAAQTSAGVTISGSSLFHNSASRYGGAVFLDDTAEVLITQSSTITNNTAPMGGGLYCAYNANLTVTTESKVRFNTAGRGGGLYAAGAAQVFGNHSRWDSNEAKESGAAVALTDAAQATYQNCRVTSNMASSLGGGFYCSSNASLILYNSLVANNTAEGSGGAIRMEDKARLRLLGDTAVAYNSVKAGCCGGLSLVSSNFHLAEAMHATYNNSAAADPDIGSPLTSITILGNTIVMGFANRLGEDEGLLHVAVNLSGYYGLPCHKALVVASLIDGTFLDTNSSNEQGIAYMTFKVARPPGLYVVTFSSTGNEHLAQSDWRPPLANLTLQIRSCIRGEVAPTPETCQQCQQGYFSFDPHAAVCETCPAYANCTGGDAIIPAPGYWRSSASSNQVHRCLNPAACQIINTTALQTCAANATGCGASNSFKEFQCSSDYIGNLCGVCSPGRGAIKLFVCKPCMRSAYIIALYALAVIVMLLIIKLLCHLTLQENINARLGDCNKPPAAELLRPLVLYSQYMLIVASMGVEWPVTLAYPLKALAWVWSPASPETLSIDCVLPKGGNLPVSIQKVLFYLCMPIVILLFLVCGEVTILQVKRARRQAVVAGLRDRLLGSTLVAIFFFLPSVLRTLFSMFACTQIDQPAEAPYIPAAVGSFWVFDMNHQCFTGYHKAWSFGLGLPLVFIVCIGIPLGVLALVLLNKRKLGDAAFMQQYGFLYKSYKDRYCCWECVVLCQTMLLVATSVFGVNLGIFYQVIVMMGTLMLMVLLLLACKPYAYRLTGKVMLQAFCCLLLTSYAALTFLQLGSVQPSPLYGYIMGTVLLLINFGFVLSVLWHLAMLVDWQRVKGVVSRMGACCGMGRSARRHTRRSKTPALSATTAAGPASCEACTTDV